MKKILLITALLLLAPLPTYAAQMALSPATGEFKTECATAANIIVNTEGQNSMAADAFLHYNPDEIEIVDQMSGVGGVQLRPGSVYESYPGNIVSNGVIRLTAFNRSGYYNGRGILGSIIFKAKPGVQTSTIRFDYSPGSTTDSNVAGIDSNDMLNGAYGATYTFKTGKCSEDSTPPVVEDLKPAPGEISVPLNSDITFVVKDSLSGVDIDTLKVQVNDITYSKEGENQFKIEGKPAKYTITINPEQDFLDRVPVRVKINVQDLDGNAMPEKTYAFNELMPVEACTPTPEILKPAAPETGFRLGMWSLWFVLLCSLIYNLKHLAGMQKKGHVIDKKTVQFTKTSIKRKRKK